MRRNPLLQLDRPLDREEMQHVRNLRALTLSEREAEFRRVDVLAMLARDPAQPERAE
jgi:hypothetical protein